MTQKFDYNKNKKEFTQEMLKDTLKYQKKYGFKLGENNSAHNNEADAFRHAYMQSLLALRYSPFLGKKTSEFHEWQGYMHNQDPREANMDLWNNQQGQQIYNEIRREYPNFNRLSEQQQKDIIAHKVVQRMKEKKLITGLDDTRKFQKQENTLPFTPTRSVGGVQKNGKSTGFAADIDINQLLNFDDINSQLEQLKQQIPEQKSGLAGYTNPLTGNNRIFTREDVEAMSNDEFSKYEKEIDAQTRAFNGTMPSNDDLQHQAMTGGGVVYVNSYTRSDGTKVKGYYRSR